MAFRTKRGMGPAVVKRDRPLRTYGKRQQPTTNATNEPPTKRRRSTFAEEHERSPTSVTDARSTKSAADDGGRATEIPKGGRAKAAKSTILTYFKPAQPIRPQPTAEEYGAVQLRASDAPRPTRRKSRLLRIRATAANRSETISEHPAGRSEASEHEQCDEEEGESREGGGRNVSARGPLGDCDKDKLNRPREEGSVSDESKRQDAKKAKKCSPSVQMTLNISPQAAFSECKVCDTVWNPLFPDDVKYHQKRHAAVLRTKKAKSAEL